MSANNFYASIKSVEDILRNGVSKLTCDDAFEEISNLILLKLIEKDIDSNKINKKVNTDTEILLDEECKFSYIYDKYCVDYEKKIEEGKIKKGDLFKLLFDNERHLDKYYDEKLDAWITKDNEKYDRLCVFKKLFHHKELSKTYQSSWKKYFKFEEKDEPDIVKSMIKINSAFNNDICTKEDIDLLGDAFEKYRDGVFGNKSGLGQYFTSQYIVQKILDEIKLTKDDKIFDPACGAGGFFIKAKNYIKEKNDKKEASKFAKNNILGCEVDPRIFKILQLNAYLHGFKFENFELCDSVKLKDKHHVEEFDALVYNPPFGASIETEKGTFPIQILNSVGLFLQLGFKALKKTGRCGVVVDQGILNNGSDKKSSWRGKIRQELLKNGLKKIILLPEGAFQYTNFAICILIYDRNYKNKKVIYEEGYFKDEDKGTRIKPLHFKNIGEITYEQIEKNNYSLVYNDYFGKKEEEIDNNKWIELGKICETKGGIKFKLEKQPVTIKTNQIYLRGQNLKDLTFKNNDYVYLDYYEERFESYKINKDDLYYVLVGSVGICGISKENAYMSGNLCSIFNTEKFGYNKKYIMYFLIFNKPDYNSNAQPNISRDTLKKILIAKLTLTHQEEIVKFLDKYFEKNNIDEFIEYLGGFNVFQLLIEKNYDFFDNLQSYIKIIKNAEKRIDVQDWKVENKRKYSKLIKEGYDLVGAYYNKIPSEDINELFESKINLIIEKELIEKKKNMQVKGIFNCYLDQSKLVKLDKIFKNIPCGKSISKHNLIDKGHPYFGANGIIGYTDKYLYDGEYILIARNGTIGAVHLFNGKFYPSDHTFTISSDKNNNKYIYLYLKKCVNWKNLSVHNGIPGITQTILKNIIIPLPHIDIQEKIVKQIEKLDEKTSHYNMYSEMIQKELDLLTETIKNICKMKEIVNDDEDDEDFNSESEQSDNESKTSKSKTKLTSKSTSKSDDNTSNKSIGSTNSTKSSKSDEIIVKPRTTKSKKDLESDDEIVSTKKSKSKKVEKLIESDSDDEPVKPFSKTESSKSKTKSSKSKVEKESPVQTKSPTKKSTSIKTLKVESESESETSESEEEKPKSKAKTVTTKSKSKSKSKLKDSDDGLDDLEKELANN